MDNDISEGLLQSSSGNDIKSMTKHLVIYLEFRIDNSAKDREASIWFPNNSYQSLNFWLCTIKNDTVTEKERVRVRKESAHEKIQQQLVFLFRLPHFIFFHRKDLPVLKFLLYLDSLEKKSAWRTKSKMEGSMDAR